MVDSAIILLRLAITVHLRSVNQAHGKLVFHAGCSHLDSVRVIHETYQKLRFDIDVLWNLARNGAQSFNQRLALCAIVNNECVVFAMR